MNKENRKVALYNLFFPVDKVPIVVNGKIIKQYYALTDSLENHFLGIKRATSHPFTQNQNAYDITRAVYKGLTEFDGEPFDHWMNEEKNKCSVIISGFRADQYASRYRHDIISLLNKKSGKTLKNIKLDFSSDFLEMDMNNPQFDNFADVKLSNLDVAVAFINGYDIDDYCNLYLIVRWIDADFRIKYLAISRKNIKFRIEEIVDYFRKDLLDFIVTSYLRYNTSIEKRFIRPVLFNIYDQNYEITTVQNDDTQREKLINFNNSTTAFANGLKAHDLNYYAITEYIIRNCYLYEGEAKRLRIKNKDNVITVNEVYSKSKSRLKNFYENDKPRENYELSNYHRLEVVEHLLE